jgi:bifunctional enzyme CysN/CysC
MRGVLRIATCGSAGGGKSTLVDRLRAEAKLSPEDQSVALAADELTSTREQGIATDVTYRFLSTSRRNFIVADAPGHERCTKSMVAGASTAEVAVVLVDAGEGVLTQTRRHSYLVSLLGIRKVVVAVNKLDLVGYSKDRFLEIEHEFRAFASQIDLKDVTCIPLSALEGDNVTVASANTDWYHGPTLRGYLETVEVTPAEDIDISRSGVPAEVDAPPEIADQFQATIIWMSDDEMLPGRPYLLKIGPATATVTMVSPKYKVNVNTLEHLAARTLRLNEIGVCNLSLDRPIVVDAYKENRRAGCFNLIDRLSNDTTGAGFLHFALRRSQNLRWQTIEVDKGAHASLKGHKPCVVWFTGLSGSGKSTIANAVEKHLHGLGLHTYLLDGDNLRHGLNRDLGFTEADRVENIRRVAEVARLMVDAGLIVLVSFISPFRAERRLARELVDPDEFCEVFVDTPLRVAEERDPKGLYKKARRGELKNFTGIDSPYESPEYPEVRIETLIQTPEQAADTIIAHLRAAGVLDPW